MGKPIDVSLLCRSWLHSREEDTPTEAVYRPSGYAFPPSRGRSGYAFSADGTFKRIGIGPTDISSVKQGRWQIDPAEPAKIRIQLDGKTKVLAVRDLSQYMMTIERPQ
jgi:hypothetical protein